MQLDHLHLHVRSRARAEAFYGRWFGMSVTRRGASVTFMRDERGFDIALMEDAVPSPMPDWFHFGFGLPSAGAVAELHARMHEAGIAMRCPLHQDGSMVSFRCTDPDGYAIEISWETPDAPLD